MQQKKKEGRFLSFENFPAQCSIIFEKNFCLTQKKFVTKSKLLFYFYDSYINITMIIQFSS